MARFCGDKDSRATLSAADAWKEQCLIGGLSLFYKARVWTAENVESLERFYVDNLDTGEGDFLSKLEKQLADAPKNTIVLCGEMLWVLLLCVSNITPEKKRETISRVISWSGTRLPMKHELLSDHALKGVGGAGSGYNLHRWRELVFLIRLAKQWFELDEVNKDGVLSDPSGLSILLERIEDQDKRQFRYMLLFMLHPDHYERVFGAGDRVKIVSEFTGDRLRQVRALSEHEIDIKLAEVRAKLESEYKTTELDWYVPPLRALWMDTSSKGSTQGGRIVPILQKFLAQTETKSLKTREYPNYHSGLVMRVSLGIGGAAFVPWIAFLAKNQKPTEGIYPVFLYYKEVDMLVLARGVSATKKPALRWQGDDLTTIKSFFDASLGSSPIRYSESYLFSAYSVREGLDLEKIESDLGELIEEYKRLVGTESVQEEPTDYLVDAESSKEEANSVQRLLADPRDDKPATKDLLGREGLVRILKGVIDSESRQHFIVSLFGKWGSGKSSVISILQERYKDSNEDSKDNHFVIFNAWQNGHSQNMTASIAEAFVDKLYSSQSAVKQLWMSLRGQWESGKSVFVFYLIATVLIFVGLSSYLLTQKDWVQEVSSSFAFAAIGLFSTVPSMVWAYLNDPYTEKLQELSKKPDFGAHIGISDAIRKQLQTLLNIYPKVESLSGLKFWQWFRERRNVRYILVVDDLDRCSDKKILETIEAVQLVVNIENVIVILAVDHEVLMRAIANQYRGQRTGLKEKEALILARDFLAKILQVTIMLEQPSLSQRKNFVKHKLYKKLTQDDIENAGGALANQANSLDHVESAYLSKEPMVIDASPINWFEYETDEDEEALFNESDDYLEHSAVEYTFFIQCVDVFNIHNPRALVRLHNVITFVKGLYPEVMEDDSKLRAYIYLVFWFEYYSTCPTSERDKMHDKLGRVSIESYSSIDNLAKDVELNRYSEDEIKKALYRIKNLSLPAVVE
ncbi:hypothetical protein NBRC116583_02610 [Arenicella sp. 4NH20-0111]|uniref:P-loop NTPase fold protein n=1 Tax=Arenicella sp. 4NH20-0111 TaxID=3127648 RepID=UPI00310241C8